MDRQNALELTKIIIPVLCGVIAWVLSVRTININQRKEEKKKLRRILYFLLELRFRIVRESSFERKLSKYLAYYMKSIREKYGIMVSSEEISLARHLLIQSSRSFFDNDQAYVKFIEEADSAIRELSEYEPFLAYELTGRHDIKGKLKFMLDLVDQYYDEEHGVSISQSMIQLAVSNELIKDLEGGMKRISKRIGFNDYKILKKFVGANGYNGEENTELDKEMTDMIDSLIEQMKNFEATS